MCTSCTSSCQYHPRHQPHHQHSTQHTLSSDGQVWKIDSKFGDISPLTQHKLKRNSYYTMLRMFADCETIYQSCSAQNLYRKGPSRVLVLVRLAMLASNVDDMTSHETSNTSHWFVRLRLLSVHQRGSRQAASLDQSTFCTCAEHGVDERFHD
jgi:hypothetical protein